MKFNIIHHSFASKLFGVSRKDGDVSTALTIIKAYIICTLILVIISTTVGLVSKEEQPIDPIALSILVSCITVFLFIIYVVVFCTQKRMRTVMMSCFYFATKVSILEFGIEFAKNYTALIESLMLLFDYAMLTELHIAYIAHLVCSFSFLYELIRFIVAVYFQQKHCNCVIKCLSLFT